MPPSENRCRHRAIAAANSGNVAPPWYALPMDLISLLGWRVLTGDLLDYVRLRAVCTQWRSSTVCPFGRGIVDPRFHPRRWMILPEGHNVHPADGKKRFFNLSTGFFVCVGLPLLTDHRILATVEGLLLLWPYRRESANILLLHPFTSDIVKLPPLMPLLKSYWAMDLGAELYRWVPLDFVASLSVSADGTAALMIVHQYITCVLFATSNDDQWSVSTWNLTPVSAPMSFKGKLYILAPPATCSSGQQILQIDPPYHEHAIMSPSLMPPKLIATCPAGKYPGYFEMAECDSEILLIGFEDIDKLVVFKLADLAMGKIIPVTSIGGNTVFLDIELSRGIQDGDVHISRSITSSYKSMPTITSNTIVRLRHNYLCQYHLSTSKWSQITGKCVHDSYNMADGFNCGLIYHIYDHCHCTEKQ
ncbi:unnamed protein product [Alopecurus aequalis]